MCPYCRIGLSNLNSGRPFVRACSTCGWWLALKEDEACSSTRYGQYGSWTRYGALSILKDLSSIPHPAPLEEIGRYLAAKWSDDVSAVTPWQFEDVATSVLAPEGWEIRATARTRDGGIDAVFEGPTGQLACLEAKHWRGKVGVKELRAFLGAMFGLAQQRSHDGNMIGLFACTSEATADAREFVDLTQVTPYRIELYDAQRFLDALRLRMSPAYRSYEHWCDTVGVVNYHFMEKEGPTYLP